LLNRLIQGEGLLGKAHPGYCDQQYQKEKFLHNILNQKTCIFQKKANAQSSPQENSKFKDIPQKERQDFSSLNLLHLNLIEFNSEDFIIAPFGRYFRGDSVEEESKSNGGSVEEESKSPPEFLSLPDQTILVDHSGQKEILTNSPPVPTKANHPKTMIGQDDLTTLVLYKKPHGRKRKKQVVKSIDFQLNNDINYPKKVIFVCNENKH
jgi:hypothetical protein